MLVKEPEVNLNSFIAVANQIHEEKEELTISSVSSSMEDREEELKHENED